MIADRLRQFRQAGCSPCDDDFAVARAWLDSSLLPLFERQHPRDIVHSANTARWLLNRGQSDPDLIVAALLHDVGKGPQRRLDRTLYVLASHAGLARALASPASRFELRRAVSRSVNHSRAGADELQLAGASSRVAELAARHHEAAGNDPVLALLQQADAAS